LQLKIDSWHTAEGSANAREQELIAKYRSHPEAKLVNVLDGGRKGWKSNAEWLRLHNDGMREVSKYVTSRADLESIAHLFIRSTSKKEVLTKIGCTEQYLNQLLRGEVHSDLWEEIPTLLDQVLAHADEHGISLGGKGGGSGTPREDRPDDLIYKAFRMYQRGISGHKIQDILNIGVNIYDVLRGKSRPNLLKRWISEGNIPPDLSREYDYQIPDKLLLMALDLKKKGWEHEAIASYVGCSIAFISCVIRGKSRPDIKKKWEIKNGILPKNNMQKRLDDAIGFAIFDLKYNKNISETEIAKQLDVSRQYAHKILKGLNKPHIKQQWESQNKKPE
jgi:transcriptional regulator with XRE-family HTH domain